jgi:ABC-type spermidine/putrescine transport system permease subunit II
VGAGGGDGGRLARALRCSHARPGGASGATRAIFAWNAVLAAIGSLLLLGLPLALLAADYHVFGTDKVGQDVLYQVLKSVRTALVIGLVTTLVMLPLSMLLGVLAGYFRGWVDDLIQYLYTTLSSIPGVLLIAAAVLMMQVLIDTHPQWFATAAERADLRLLALCFILGVTSWTGLCRLLRGETLKLRELEYIQAAQAFGVSDLRIIARHILPNLMHIVIIALVMDFSEPGAGRGGALLRRHRRRSDDDQLRHDDQQCAHGAGARTDGLVVAGGGFRFHVHAGAGSEPARRCRARRLRSASGGVGMSREPAVSEERLLAGARSCASLSQRRALAAAGGRRHVFQVAAGETLALLGESGCGKSATALALLRLLPAAGRIVGGEVRFAGRDLLRLPKPRCAACAAAAWR